MPNKCFWYTSPKAVWLTIHCNIFISAIGPMTTSSNTRMYYCNWLYSAWQAQHHNEGFIVALSTNDSTYYSSIPELTDNTSSYGSSWTMNVLIVSSFEADVNWCEAAFRTERIRRQPASFMTGALRKMASASHCFSTILRHAITVARGLHLSSGSIQCDTRMPT